MKRFAAALAALALGLVCPAQAQDFPNRTINMNVYKRQGRAARRRHPMAIR